MDPRHIKYIRSRMIPPPQKIKITNCDVWPIADGARLRILSPAPEAAELARKFFRIHCSAEPAAVQETISAGLPPEGYKLDVAKDSCTITAETLQGVRYALNTIRQLMESERGVLSSMKKQLPCVEVEDFPALSFRGIHLCWFPETPVWEIERQIRLAAYYKFNYAIIESWGVLQFESHPEFCWPEYAVPKAEIRRLLQLGKELGIRLLPQLNLFGHASCARNWCGKHVLLSTHSEYEPLFEPDGWTWCISNPAARQYLKEMVVELVELFEDPPYFHIGCDEAYSPESCSLCMHDYPAKLADHITFFHDLLAARGCKTMMWHDMLLNREDPRWEGYIVCGHEENKLDNLLRDLPRSIILCDWQYRYPEKDGQEPDWPTCRYLKSQGFPVIPCPWDDARGGLSLGRCAVREHLDGFLQTVWHHGQKSFRLLPIFVQGAHGAWSPMTEDAGDKHVQLNHHLRQLDHEMGLTAYHQLGSVQYQVDPAPFQD